MKKGEGGQTIRLIRPRSERERKGIGRNSRVWKRKWRNRRKGMEE